jgi:predicted secreted protein
MTAAVTAKYEELYLEVEFTASSGTYTKVCGLTDLTISYTNNVETTEVPDCDDESLPHTVERAVKSNEWSASGAGVWAQTSHENMFQWWKGGAAKNVRIGYTKASVGDVELVAGAAILASLEHARAKGQKVTASVSIVSSGVVTTTDQT